MPTPITQTQQPPTFVSQCINVLSWMNLFALLTVSLLLFVVSENWWFSSAMTYMPRYPYLIPAAVLLLASVLWHRASIPLNLMSFAMVVVPIMGLTLPVTNWISNPNSAGGPALKIISCNVQCFRPDFASVLAEFGKMNPDIVALQDASASSKLLDKYFETWHTIRDGEFYLASRYPFKQVQVGHFDAFDRDAIVKYEIQLPTSKITLYSLHHMTPRHGLRELDLSSPITQNGSTRLSRYLELRAEETADVRHFVDQSGDGSPALVVGDFNMPYDSCLYQKNWQGYQNAFNIAGSGYGYTFPCNRQFGLPGGMPWMRLDHILADSQWIVQSCTVGTANGSDHRMIAATLLLPSGSIQQQASLPVSPAASNH